jgi:hypothetical protein
MLLLLSQFDGDEKAAAEGTEVSTGDRFHAASLRRYYPNRFKGFPFRRNLSLHRKLPRDRTMAENTPFSCRVKLRLPFISVGYGA